jgi:iron complex transport system substrate-binding protein
LLPHASCGVHELLSKTLHTDPEPVVGSGPGNSVSYERPPPVNRLWRKFIADSDPGPKHAGYARAADINRRGFLGAAGAAGLFVISVRNSGLATGAPAGGPLTIQHRFGQTTIPAPPKRVVSAGFTEQDDLIAVGVVPIAVTLWWGDEPHEVWAQPKLGSAQPEVLSIYDGGIQFDRIAALRPDLIVAINAGVDQDSYNRLPAIAPTIPQSGDAPFFEP